LTTLGYGGAVWYSFQSDNFHDFFTEYVPGSTQVIQVIQDYQFNQRYPRHPSIRKGDRISDLAKGGPHISAIEANRPEIIEKTKQDAKKEKAEAAKKDEERKKGKGRGKTEKEQKGPTIDLTPATSTPPQTSEKAKEAVQGEPAVKRDPTGKSAQGDIAKAPTTEQLSERDVKSSEDGPKEKKKATPKPAEPKESTVHLPAPPITDVSAVTEGSDASGVKVLQLQIDPLDISPNDPALEKVTNALNNLINSLNKLDKATVSASAPLYEFLKNSISELNTHLPNLINSTREEAVAQIQQQADYFNKLHQELQAAMIQERNLMANEWMAAFDREREDLQHRYNERLTEELKVQSDVNDKRLENELLEQAIALRRRWAREIQSQVEMERGGRLGKLAALEKALGELVGLHQDSQSVFSRAEKAKKTALAVQALKDAALNRPGGFVNELAALKMLAGQDDLVRAIIASIDPEAYSRGIVSQAELAQRFQSLATELRKISLLPEDAGVAGHAASWLLSKFMFRQRGYVKGDDVDSRLARVEVLLEAGQLEDAAREVNSFTGWGRELSRDWLREARKRLEVVQAIDVIILALNELTIGSRDANGIRCAGNHIR